MKEMYFDLLKQWCDELIKLQLSGTGFDELDGALICPACHIIHGRCHDAVYPLMYMADTTGDKKYLAAAKALFRWAKNLLANDGSFYNDAQSPWNGITVFTTNNLAHALMHHSHLLTAEEKAEWEDRLRINADWLHDYLDDNSRYVINYVANCAGALALVGKYFDSEKYRYRARYMADLAFQHFTENDLIMGEGHPRLAKSPKGCRAIDLGYNVEETLAALLRYAVISGDMAAKAKVIASMRAHLDFMLPDGGWDNSFTSRNHKWSYWGSRTSDGCQISYASPDTGVPEFVEAALRNLELYKKCSYGGLLYGGPHYRAHGEKACIHHSFCHAAALAAALDAGIPEYARCAIPADAPEAVKYYSELDTYKLASGDFRATVTGYDFDYTTGGHVSGGVMSLLWHKKTGPILATGMSDYALKEPTNMQQSLKKDSVAPLAARMELDIDGVRYSQMYDFKCDITASGDAECVTADAAAALVDIDRNEPAMRTSCAMHYEITPAYTALTGRVSAGAIDKAAFIVPIILSDDEAWEYDGGNTIVLHREGGDVRVTYSALKREPRRIFNFSGGFSALELAISRDAAGAFSAKIEVI